MDLDVSRPVHIVVAEDNPVLAQLLALQLGHDGYRVTCIADGQELIERIAGLSPSLLLLDLGLPTLDGFEVLSMLGRERPDQAPSLPFPVVVISGRISDESVEDAARLGAAETLFKPYDYNHLIEVITRSLHEPRRYEPVIGC